MKDAEKWTAKELERLEKRINAQYKQAQKEIQKRMQKYFLEFKARYKVEYAAYEQGKYTKQQFEVWYLSQVGRGKHWEELRDDIARRISQLNRTTAADINDTLAAIYAANSNAVAGIAQKSAIEQGVLGIKFDLVDKHAVAELMKGAREVRPYKAIALNLPKDLHWNRTKLQNALLQGILQGDSIDHIADRFQAVTKMNRDAAIRNARTSVTGAQSAGKQARYEEIQKMGGIVYKTWSAANDERTRPEHAEADGQEVTYDDPFIVGDEELMYPADPAGSGWNIYNCRCSMNARFEFRSILDFDAGIEVK